MEKSATLNLRVNPTLKSDAETILSRLGIPMSTAVDMFLNQVVLVGGIPFSVTVPKLSVTIEHASAKLPYSFSDTSAELDDAVTAFSELLPLLIELAEVEKTCNMLADEIEKNRRRVNALEYVMIPELEETIKYISMKLEEQERSNVVRLMKVKDMIQNRD